MNEVKNLIKKAEEDNLDDKTLADVIVSLKELANGYYFYKKTLSGERRIYDEKKPPNVEAAKYLADRILGKPAQKIMGPGGQGEFLYRPVTLSKEDMEKENQRGKEKYARNTSAS